jgi:hypothetical protein
MSDLDILTSINLDDDVGGSSHPLMGVDMFANIASDGGENGAGDEIKIDIQDIGEIGSGAVDFDDKGFSKITVEDGSRPSVSFASNPRVFASQSPAPPSAPVEPKKTEAELFADKLDLLHKFERLEKKWDEEGKTFPYKYDHNSNIDEMRITYEKLRRNQEITNSIKFQRNMLMSFVTGVEYLNGKFDPFGIRLDGWGESVNENLADYDDVFEQLHEKYKERAKMPPELTLLMQLGSSAFMFNLTKTMFANTKIPGLDSVLRGNPELARDFAKAAMRKMGDDVAGASKFAEAFSAPPPSKPFNPPPPPKPTAKVRREMKGPSGFDFMGGINQMAAKAPEEIEVKSIHTDDDGGSVVSTQSRARIRRTENGGRTIDLG